MSVRQDRPDRQDRHLSPEFVKSFTAEVRATLKQEGISQHALAEASAINEGRLCCLLQGRDYLGPERARRLQEGLNKLVSARRNLQDELHALAATATASTDRSDRTNDGMPTVAAEAPGSAPKPNIRRL